MDGHVLKFIDRELASRFYAFAPLKQSGLPGFAPKDYELATC